MNKLLDQMPMNGIAAWRPAAVLCATGDDALAFLQGQFTQELRPDRSGRVAYGLWLNQKGKVLADSYVLRSDERCWYIVSWSSPAVVIRERLEAYIIADDVELQDETSRWEGWLGLGEAGRQWLEAQGVPWPSAQDWAVTDTGMVFRCSPPWNEAAVWLVPVGGVQEQPVSPIHSVRLHQARIAAGFPLIPQELGSSDLPQEAGLERTALSVTKGCYLGQEVMARLQSQGRVRRKLVRVGGDGPLPARGTPLRQGERVIGELRGASGDGGGGWLGLAMVSLVSWNRDLPVSYGEVVQPLHLWDLPDAS